MTHGLCLRARDVLTSITQETHARLRETSVRAAECCDADLRALASRFPVHLRFRIYARLLADRTGRLAELVTSSPGVLIFALALLERPEEESVIAGKGLLRDASRGVTGR